MQISPIQIPSLFLLLWLSGVTAAHAEHADRNKPINIDADRVIIDDARQISTFVGKVEMSQGTMVIRGDKIVVAQDKDGFKQGTAYGRTASFRQKREGLNEYVEGSAERIVYDTQTETVDFYVQARVKRSQDEVRGEHVTYNSRTEIFQADGKGSKADNGTSGRVHAVLHPKPRTEPRAEETDKVDEPVKDISPSKPVGTAPSMEKK